ncbi:beta-galactosidase [[Empedobacter] haloabium]|uniref:beta-galactosidase n=1 Tax=[Empedobacter] haloabium TaxID=592317 RepID=A0ABZ1UQP3_9BURK
MPSFLPLSAGRALFLLGTFLLQVVKPVTAQELGIPQASDVIRVSQVRDADTSTTWVMAATTTTSPGTISLFASTDGVTYTSLAADAVRPTGANPRAPALLRHDDGAYYLLYATASHDLTLARSRDLRHWEAGRPVPFDGGEIATLRWQRGADGAPQVVAGTTAGATWLLSPDAALAAWRQAQAGAAGDAGAPRPDWKGAAAGVREASVLRLDRQAFEAATQPRNRPKQISWDQYSLKIDGERVVIWSGEVHPFRLPNPSLWRDVLQKMKAVGFNAVAFYFDWGYHSPAPGVYDFSHVRNVERALEIAEEEGLYVIARTGPYVNAELTGGGFPGWMLRHRAEARTDDPAYLAAVDEWMTQINAIVARHQLTTGGGSVIAYQLENELGKVEPKHVRQMEHLAAKARRDGITVPLFHNAAGRLPDWTPRGSSAPWANAGPTDLYAFDGYPGGTCNVHADPAGPNRAPDWGIYGNGLPKTGALSSPGTPGFAAELGGGWFDYWGSNSTYGCTAERQGKGYQRVFYGTNLINRITIHNVYMTFGGTSWGWLAGPVVYTSYDYGAPIAEDRGLRPKALALKQQGMFVQAARQALAQMDKGPAIAASSPNVKVYHNVNPVLGTHVLFAVHAPSDRTSDDAFTFDLATRDGTYRVPLRLNGQDGKLLLADFPLARQHLVYSTSELQAQLVQGERDVVLLHGRTGEAGETLLRYATEPRVEVLAGQVGSRYENGVLKLTYVHDGLARVRIAGGGHAPLLLLLADERHSQDFWLHRTAAGPVLALTPALVRGATVADGRLDLTGDTTAASPLELWAPDVERAAFNGATLALTPQPDGSLRAAPLAGPAAVRLPDLMAQRWLRRMDSPESRPGFDDSGWARADTRASAAQTWTTPERGQPTLAMSDYGFHHGDVWYRGRVTVTDPHTNQLELFYGAGGAGMLQVWVDGRFVGQHELDTGRQFPETTDSARFSLGTLARGEHVIAVMVRNNSHNWDLMADDAHREARGLIAASLTARGGRRFAVPIAWRLQGNLGGEAIADPVRGPMNNGGLYGERAGWHLPGAMADGWRASAPTAPPPAPGTYWLRTTFELDLPRGHDVQLGLAFGDTARPRSERENRALLFVNGWNMGQFIAHVGPQRTFVIPPGILNPNGVNTLALAVTTDGQRGNALEPVRLVNLRTARGGVPLELMPGATPSSVR